AASNRRATERLEAEAKALEQQFADSKEEVKQQVVAMAQQVTDWVISRMAEAEGVWRSALVTLRAKLPPEDAVRLLHNQLDMVESAWRLIRAARGLWAVAEKFGIVPERVAELDSTERGFLELAAEAKRALE